MCCGRAWLWCDRDAHSCDSDWLSDSDWKKAWHGNNMSLIICGWNMPPHDFIFSQMFLKHALGTRVGPQMYEKLLTWSGIFFDGNMNIEIWTMWIWGICRAIYTYFLQKHVKTWASSKSFFGFKFLGAQNYFLYFLVGGAPTGPVGRIHIFAWKNNSFLGFSYFLY